MLVKLKPFSEIFKEDEIRDLLCASGADSSNEVDFEGFLKVTLFHAFNLNGSILVRFDPEIVKQAR